LGGANLSGVSKSLVAAKLLTGLLSLLTVPLLLNSLGIVSYGYYLIISSFILIASFVDLGLSNGAINRFANTKTVADSTDLILGLLFSLFVMSLLSIFLFISLFPLFDWDSIFKLQATNQLNLNREIYIGGIFCAFIPFTNLASKLMVAKSNNSAAARLITINAIFSNVLVVILAYFQQSIGSLVAAQILAPIFTNLFFLCKMIDLSRVKIHGIHFYFSSMQQNLRLGSVFLVLQVTTIFSYHVDNFIVGHFLGPIAVVELATVWKLCVVPTLLVSAGVAPLWGNSAILNSQTRTSTAIKEAISTIRKIRNPLIAFCIIFCFFGKQFVVLWTNGSVQPSNLTVIAAVCWVMIYTITQPIAMMLNGIEQFRFVVYTAILSTFGNVLFSIAFTSIFRLPAGPLLGSVVSQILFYLLPFWFIFIYRFSKPI